MDIIELLLSSNPPVLLSGLLVFAGTTLFSLLIHYWKRRSVALNIRNEIESIISHYISNEKVIREHLEGGKQLKKEKIKQFPYGEAEFYSITSSDVTSVCPIASKNIMKYRLKLRNDRIFLTNFAASWDDNAPAQKKRDMLVELSRLLEGSVQRGSEISRMLASYAWKPVFPAPDCVNWADKLTIEKIFNEIVGKA